MLKLNLVRFKYPEDSTLAIKLVPYEDRDQFLGLRKRLAGNHVVRRSGESVAVIPSKANYSSRTGKYHAKRATPHEVAALLADWLISHFYGQNRRVIQKGRVLHILSSQKEDDLLDTAYRRLTLPGICLNRAFKLAVRVESPDKEKQVFLSIDTAVVARIETDLVELTARGIDLTGLYAVRQLDSIDPRVEPKKRLAGRIRKIEGPFVYLEDFDPELTDSRIHISEAKLEARVETLASIISQFRSSNVEQEFDRITSAIDRKSVGKSKLKKINRFVAYLKKLGRIWISPELGGVFIDFEGIRPSFRMKRLRQPEHIFDPGGRRSDVWHQRGLDRHGPFDKDSFSPKKLNIAVVCQARYQGQVEEFVEHFLNGVPNHRSHIGFIRRFSLEKPYLQVFASKDETSKSYRSVCVEAIEHIADRGDQWHLVLVQVEKVMEALTGDDNPYFVTKAFFLSKDIAVQHFHFRTAKQAAYNRGYTLNNMGLATYAKLGGIPWLLPVTNKLAHELVFGLGSHHEKSSRFGSSERYVGITTVFSGDGRYLFENRTKAVPFEDYSTELSKTVLTAIRQRQTEQAWSSDDPVRLIFHVFKPVKNAEAEAIKNVVGQLSLTRVEYAFVHVVEAHPFQVFNTNEEGVSAGQHRKGVKAPPRGLKTDLSDFEAIVCLKGARELKKPTDGHPKPIMIRVHRLSTFRDITYLAQQVYSFSCHSWRTFFPAPLPVTILYSELIAENLRNLNQVSRWSDQDLAGRTGRTRWFL